MSANQRLFNLSFVFIALLSQGCLERPKEKLPATGTSAVLSNLTGLTLKEKKQESLFGVSFHMHKAGTVSHADAKGTVSPYLESKSTECIVNSNEVGVGNSSNDILCWLEGKELDLTFHGVELELQVPPGMCNYITVEPFWFWSWQPGQSTYTVVQNIVSEDCNNASTGAAADWNCLGGSDAGPYYQDNAGNYPWSNAAGFGCKELYDSYNRTNAGKLEGNKLCLFDHSQGDEDDTKGPNCDTGTVKYVTINWTKITGTNDCEASDPVVTEVKCGGKTANCAAGPGEAFSKNTSGFPNKVYYNALEGGLLSKLAVKGGGESVIGSPTNLSISNFTRACSAETEATTRLGVGQESGVLNTDYYAKRLQEYPNSGGLSTLNAAEYDAYLSQFLSAAEITTFKTDIQKDAGGAYPTTVTAIRDPFFRAPGGSPRPFYTWTCLDESEDIKARIRLQIRSWDRTFDASTDNINQVYPITSSVNKMDFGGSETFPDSGHSPWDDIHDWDDASLATGFNDLGQHFWHDTQIVGGATTNVFENNVNCHAPSNVYPDGDGNRNDGHFYFMNFTPSITATVTNSSGTEE
jgi:hypothetical protein